MKTILWLAAAVAGLNVWTARADTSASSGPNGAGGGGSLSITNFTASTYAAGVVVGSTIGTNLDATKLTGTVPGANLPAALVTNNWVGPELLLDTNNTKVNVFGGAAVELGKSLFMYGNTALSSGSYNVELGQNNNASGARWLTAIGSANALGSQDYGTAIGQQNSVGGGYGMALGLANKVNTNNPTDGKTRGMAFGQFNTAGGNNAMAIGQLGRADADNSLVLSDGTIQLHSSVANTLVAYWANGYYLLGGALQANGGGLTNVPAASITGALNTNITLSGVTKLFITNGLIMGVQ